MDAYGYWQYQPELGDGAHSLTVATGNLVSPPFGFTVESTPLTVASLLAEHEAPLFATDAPAEHSPVATAQHELDVSDLGQVQPGGIHADVAGNIGGPAMHQEEVQHA